MTPARAPIPTLKEMIDSHPTPSPSAAPSDDPVCTDCHGTGITDQTERRCACQGPALASPSAEAAQPVAWRWRWTKEAAGLEAADALDAAKDQLRYFGELHEKEFRASEARATALEKVLAKVTDLLTEYREKTPLGHQPHMIAHRADDAIATARAALLSAKGGETP